MEFFRKILFVAITVLPLFSYSQIKVACIGNSITYGAGIDNREQNSYPAQLSKLLSAYWLIENYGVSGATLLKKGDRPYWKQKAFGEAKGLNPDVVIIKLGTNDTKPHNWEFKENFISDYIALIEEFKSLPSKPVIFICLPVPAFPERWGIRDSIITTDVIPMLKTIAKKTDVEIIDLHKPLLNHEDWFPDKIHPNTEGAGEIANIIHKVLLDNKKKIENRKI